MMKLDDLVVEDEVECLPVLGAGRPLPVMIEVTPAPLKEQMLKPLKLYGKEWGPFSGVDIRQALPCACDTPGCMEGPDHRFNPFKGIDINVVLEVFDEDDD
jgi:hypothetical protein